MPGRKKEKGQRKKKQGIAPEKPAINPAEAKDNAEISRSTVKNSLKTAQKLAKAGDPRGLATLGAIHLTCFEDDNSLDEAAKAIIKFAKADEDFKPNKEAGLQMLHEASKAGSLDASERLIEYYAAKPEKTLDDLATLGALLKAKEAREEGALALAKLIGSLGINKPQKQKGAGERVYGAPPEFFPSDRSNVRGRLRKKAENLPIEEEAPSRSRSPSSGAGVD